MHGPLQCPLTAESRAPLLHCARRSDSLPAPTRAPAARLPPEYFLSTSPVRRAEHAWPRRSARFEFHGAARATSPASALSIASPPDVRCLATSPVQHWPPIHATIRRTASTGFRCALQTRGIAHASGVNESARALPVMRQHERMLPSPVVALLPPWQSAHRLHCRTSRFHDLSPAVLSSHLYRGEIVHKGVAYPGQHAAIVPKPLWEKVQAILTENDKGLGAPGRPRSQTEAVLRGLLFAPDGEKMQPTFTRKPSGKRYRYYVSARDRRFGAGAGSMGMLPAAEIEDLVLTQVQAALAAPEVVQSVWQRVQAATPNIEESVVVLALRNLSTLWTQLFPAEQQRIVQLLIERVQLREEGIDIQWRESGWQQWAGELTAGTIGGELCAWEERQHEADPASGRGRSAAENGRDRRQIHHFYSCPVQEARRVHGHRAGPGGRRRSGKPFCVARKNPAILRYGTPDRTGPRFPLAAITG